MNFNLIDEIEILDNYYIKARFKDGTIKKYDIKPLFNKLPSFGLLKQKNIFKLVKIDKGGYGLSWNENIDLSSEEIWNNGEIVNE